MKMKFILLISFYLYSSCVADYDSQWWKSTIIYEILPYSFKDSDGDGTGDIRGIISKLDHFVDLGIETIHLTPIYATSMRDMGYDVSDYCAINPMYGTMDDFDKLMSELKKRDMKILLDFVINHSGYKHEWFTKSIDRIDPYTDFYVWIDSKGYDSDTQSEIPPNRWSNIFDNDNPGSAWTWNEKRKQFYYHHFLPEQPDFNLNNEILKEKLKEIMKFWLDKGVAGFRLDAATALFEDKLLRDDDNYWRQYSQEENFPFLHEMRLFLDEYSRQHGDFERIFVPEARSADDYLLKLYDQENYLMTQLPYTFTFQQIFNELSAPKFHNFIEPWLKKLPNDAVSLWMTEDHDGWRVGTRIRPEYSDILTMTAMMLPGSAGCYYGQEIAMTVGFVRLDQIKDFSGKGGRDPARLPMQWDNSMNAGFSTNIETYLPLNPDFFTRNVECQKEESISHYNMFKDLSILRKTDTFKYGAIKLYVGSEYTYIFTRSFKNQIFIVVINLSSLLSRVQLNQTIRGLPESVTVRAASVNSGYEKGSQLMDELNIGFLMRPLSCIVFEGKF